MSDPGDWTTNEGACLHFLRLAQDSGIFLENRLAEIASAFAKEVTRQKGVRVSAESIAYGHDTENSPLRQIDHRINFYKEFILDERTGIQLIMSVPVEAKYRRDVEACAVEYPAESYRPALPLVSSLHGSQLGATLRSVTPFGQYKLSQPVFIEVEKGTTPKRVFQENLLYNAASAIYDFIHFECEERRHDPLGQDFIAKAQLIGRFEKYLSEKHYVWWSVIHDWMKENLTPALVSEFNRQYLPTRCFFSVHIYIPVLFISCLLHELATGDNKVNPVFQPCNALITRVRVPGWPGKLRQELLGYTAEAPLIVTNDKGLPQILNDCLDTFLALETTLKQSRTTIGERWPLESTFYQSALKHFLNEDDSALRSDLDIFQWLHPLE